MAETTKTNNADFTSQSNSNNDKTNTEISTSLTNTSPNTTKNSTLSQKEDDLADDGIICPICHDIMVEVFMTFCGHSYCYLCISKHLDRRLDCPVCRASLSRDQLFPNFQLNRVAEQRLKSNPPSVTSNDSSPANIEQYFNKLPYNELISILSSAVAKQEKAKNQEKDIQKGLLSIFLNLLEKHNLKLAEDLEQELNMIRRDIHSIGSKDKKGLTKKGTLSPKKNHSRSGDSCHNNEIESSNNDDHDDNILSEESKKRKIIFEENELPSTKYQKIGDGKNIITNPILASRKKLIEQRFDDLRELYLMDRQKHSSNGLDKFSSKLHELTRYTDFKELDTMYYTDISVNSAIVSSIEFDRDEDYIAVGGVTKEIKIFDFNMMNKELDDNNNNNDNDDSDDSDDNNTNNQLLNDQSIDSDSTSEDSSQINQNTSMNNNNNHNDRYIGRNNRRRKPLSFVHCPIRVMHCDHKISCLSWNPYIKSSLASSDYEGVINLWDMNHCQIVRSYEEHKRRAWSIDTSKSNPTLMASGSDDSTVKIWSIHTRKSVHTLEQRGNVCCAKFAPNNNHHVAIGSVDHQVSCYDLRSPKIPFKTFNGHKKAVSYVKWLNDNEIVSASTDSSLKLWNLNKDDCEKTFSGHQNEKNFVGLSVKDDWIACGSESNTVYTYHKNSRYPVAQYKFPVTNPISGQGTFEEDASLFVSSLCWKNDDSMKMVVANSKGMIKVLQLEE